MSLASRGVPEPVEERSGVFIVLEGPEGAGKSTQIALLASRLKGLGRDCVLTREPGGTQAGDAIRRVVLDPSQRIEPLTEFLLYSASRAQLVAEVIAPALSDGRDVISDRYTGASVAYQGYGRGLDLDLIDSLNHRATGGLKPDVTVLLDIDPAEGLEFHARVRAGFVEQARSRPDWLLVDGAAKPEDVAEVIWGAVETLLSQRRQRATL